MTELDGGSGNNAFAEAVQCGESAPASVVEHRADRVDQVGQEYRVDLGDRVDRIDRANRIEAVPSSGEIAVADMDYQLSELTGVDGSRFYEITSNLWARFGENPPCVVYLGTGRHGGGIVLRPMYVRSSDGSWINTSSGKPISPSLSAKFITHETGQQARCPLS